MEVCGLANLILKDPALFGRKQLDAAGETQAILKDSGFIRKTSGGGNVVFPELTRRKELSSLPLERWTRTERQPTNIPSQLHQITLPDGPPGIAIDGIISLSRLLADGRTGLTRLADVRLFPPSVRRRLSDDGFLNDFRSGEPKFREGVLNKIPFHQPRVRADDTMNRYGLVEAALASVQGPLVLQPPGRTVVDFHLDRQVDKLGGAAKCRDQQMQN